MSWAAVGVLAPLVVVAIGVTYRAGSRVGELVSELRDLRSWRDNHQAEHLAMWYGYQPRDFRPAMPETWLRRPPWGPGGGQHGG